MKINIIGGGPAGMYFAILMKQADAAHDITIYERNGPDDTFGWGVVFSGKTLANLRKADETSHAEITRDFEAWDNVDVVHREEKISIHGNSFSGIARIRLLKILQRRCEDLGIQIHFRNEVSDIKSLKDACDLLVGADGVNSTMRQQFAEHFQPNLSTRPNKYIWYGTNQLFHGLTLTFRESAAGVFAAHSYKFDKTTSTFIVECDAQTWDQAGFATLPDEETRRYVSEVFASDLGGHALLSNNSKWINFVLVKNANWHFENVVLLGDALHTAHFSIGSGTKLAIEDAITLKQSFDDAHDVRSALTRFEKARKPVIEDYQAAAYESMLWFENAREYLHLSPIELAYSLMKRSGRVDDEELRKRDPAFLARVEDKYTSNSFRSGTLVKTASGWKSIEDICEGELVWTHEGRLKPVSDLRSHSHVGRIVGLKLRNCAAMVWVSPEQRFLSPSPQAERGLGGEVGDDANPTPNPSPLAGRGEGHQSVHRQLGGYAARLSYAARRLRRESTPAEKLLWESLRSRQLKGAKFRRQHPLGANYIVDLYCPIARLAIELDGSVHDSTRAAWSDGIRHRQIQFADVRILRFRNDEVLKKLDSVLEVIADALSVSVDTTGAWLRAEELSVGSLLVSNETSSINEVESIESEFTRERLFSLSVEEDHSFVTQCGIARG